MGSLFCTCGESALIETAQRPKRGLRWPSCRPTPGCDGRHVPPDAPPAGSWEEAEDDAVSAVLAAFPGARVGHPVIVGDEYFPTKAAAEKRCREILYGHSLFEPIASDDAEFLVDLIELHQRAAEKIGAGLDHFEVQPVAGYNARGFQLFRADGTATDFSYKRCLNPADRRTQVKRAMRRAVKDQVLDFKARWFDEGGSRCEITGEPVTYDDCHVDHHEPTFDELAEQFITDEGGAERHRPRYR